MGFARSITLRGRLDLFYFLDGFLVCFRWYMRALTAPRTRFTLRMNAVVGLR